MPKFRMNVSVQQKGVIFKASATRSAGVKMVTSINENLAQEGVNRVRNRLSHVLQNPTGYYESKITIRTGQTYRGVWDSNVIYGGWLEGLSSRNKSTRFKGYHVFREIQQQLAKEKVRLAQPYVDNYIEALS